jgi:hypothetical protein
VAGGSSHTKIAYASDRAGISAFKSWKATMFKLDELLNWQWNSEEAYSTIGSMPSAAAVVPALTMQRGPKEPAQGFERGKEKRHKSRIASVDNGGCGVLAVEGMGSRLRYWLLWLPLERRLHGLQASTCQCLTIVTLLEAAPSDPQNSCKALKSF